MPELLLKFPTKIPDSSVMGLHELLNTPVDEETLVARVVCTIQRDWDQYLNVFVCLDLARIGDVKIGQGQTFVKQVHEFKTYEEFFRHIWIREFNFSRTAFIYEDGYYKFLHQGYEMSNGIFIFKDELEVEHKFIAEMSSDNDKMPPYELIVEGFGDISGLFKPKRRKVPV